MFISLLVVTLVMFIIVWVLTHMGKPSVDYTPEDKERDDITEYIKEACRIGILCEHCGAVYDSNELIDGDSCPECKRRLI